MDTKWISSAGLWWRDYRIWIRNIENVFIIVFALLIPTFITILFGGVSFPNIVKLNYVENQTITSRVVYRDALFNPIQYKEAKLLAGSIELSKIVYDQTNYLKDIEEAKTKEEKEKIILGLQECSIYYSGIVLINKKNGDYYSNRPWFYEPPYSLSTPKEVIEGLARDSKWVYKILNPTENIEEIYFSEGKSYDKEIYSIRMSFILTFMTTFIFIILIIKKMVMIKHLGRSNYLKSLRYGYLYKVINSINILLNRNILVEEVIKDRVLLFTLFVTIVYSVFFGLISQVDFWLGYPKYYNNILYIGVSVFLVLHFTFKFIRKYDALATIIEGLDSIKQGNMEFEIEANEDKQIRELAKGINTLRIDYRDSIEESVRNEKLKTELISNVSHDLKTPLTSIINYVNILQRDDVKHDEKVEYIKILETKSYRLKRLIDDLFEVSKMNSGKVNLTKMDIDIVQLVYQCIMEVEDVYSEKGMEFRVKAPEELIINVDPERISRVFQNLATNSLKYGLEGTRIFIEIEEMKDRVEVSFKNISAFELNFDENEILERFARGDKSRNSAIEGSGLGLAIAKSIMELHGGDFRVECEGDLFKAFVIIPKVDEKLNMNKI